MLGDLTPEAICKWEMGCRQYFKHKEVPTNEQVGKVAWGMQEPSIQDWYLNDQDHMDSLTFTEYMAEFHAYWLPSDWDDVTHQKLLSSCQGDKLFSEWVVEVQSLNSLLHGIPSQLTELSICHHLEAHMLPDLRMEYCAKKVKEIQNFHPWLEAIHVLDKKRM
ncbi:hypothetical protein EDD22DRAFT_781129, partial [Suillus occidentalis]